MQRSCSACGRPPPGLTFHSSSKMPSLQSINKKQQGWVFTLNNYTEEDVERILHLPISSPSIQYVCFGKEIGEQGTHHLQGYIHFKCQVRRGTVSKALPNAYVAARKGDLGEAIAYCKKDGLFFSEGNLRIPSKSSKWGDIIELAEEGKLDEIKEEYPLVYLMHRPKLESLMNPHLEAFEDDPKNHFEWWVGPTGTGKSRELWNKFPVHYDKQLNKWWDGYLYHEVVAIEEADPKKCEHMAYFFKRWCDHYPFRAEIKNGHLNNIRPAKIIVTSNYTIKECFPNQQDWEPLLRRFKVVHFDSLHTPVVLSPIEPAIDPEYHIPQVVTSEEVNPLFLEYDNGDLEAYIHSLEL